MPRCTAHKVLLHLLASLKCASVPKYNPIKASVTAIDDFMQQHAQNATALAYGCQTLSDVVDTCQDPSLVLHLCDIVLPTVLCSMQDNPTSLRLQLRGCQLLEALARKVHQSNPQGKALLHGALPLLQPVPTHPARVLVEAYSLLPLSGKPFYSHGATCLAAAERETFLLPLTAGVVAVTEQPLCCCH